MGTTHFERLKRRNEPSLRDFTEGVHLFRGLKSTVTIWVEPMVLLLYEE